MAWSSTDIQCVSVLRYSFCAICVLQCIFLGKKWRLQGECSSSLLTFWWKTLQMRMRNFALIHRANGFLVVSPRSCACSVVILYLRCSCAYLSNNNCGWTNLIYTCAIGYAVVEVHGRRLITWCLVKCGEHASFLSTFLFILFPLLLRERTRTICSLSSELIIDRRVGSALCSPYVTRVLSRYKGKRKRATEAPAK